MCGPLILSLTFTAEMDGFMMWLLMSLVGASHAVQYVETQIHTDASCSSGGVRSAAAADVCAGQSPIY